MPSPFNINMHEFGCMKHSCAYREKDGSRDDKNKEKVREGIVFYFTSGTIGTHSHHIPTPHN